MSRISHFLLPTHKHTAKYILLNKYKATRDHGLCEASICRQVLAESWSRCLRNFPLKCQVWKAQLSEATGAKCHNMCSYTANHQGPWVNCTLERTSIFTYKSLQMHLYCPIYWDIHLYILQFSYLELKNINWNVHFTICISKK